MKKVLIVDDEILVRKGLQSLFPWKDHGYDIYADAKSGNEALEIMERDKPDVLLTDLYMEDGDGFFLIGNVRRRWPEIKIVVLSSYNDFDNVRRAMKAGASDYVFKLSVRAEELLGILDEVVSDVGNSRSESINEEKEEALLDSFPFAFGYFVIVVRLDDSEIISRKKQFGDNRRVMQIISSMISSELSKIGRNAVTSLGKWGFFAVVDQAGAAGVEKLLTALSHRMESTIGVKISMAVTRPGFSRKELDALIEEGEDLLKELFFSRDPVATAESASRKRTPLPWEYTFDSYRMLLETRNIEGAVSLFKKHLAYLEVSGGIFEDEVKDMMREVSGILSVLFLFSGMDISCVRDEGLSIYDSIRYHDRFCTMKASLERIIAKAEEEIALHRPSRKEVQDAVDYVINNMGRDISVREAAEHVNMSESNFSHVFSEEKGISFARFVSKVKMDRAASLLGSTDMRISEVADAVGISNPNYFSVLFRKAHGLTPQEYRSSVAGK